MGGLANATIRPADKPYTKDDESTLLFGLPLPTHMYGYQLREGRWLEPGDVYAITMSTKLARDVGVEVGDWVTIRYEEKRESTWQVVGLFYDPILTNATAVNGDLLLQDLHLPG